MASSASGAGTPSESAGATPEKMSEPDTEATEDAGGSKGKEPAVKKKETVGEDHDKSKEKEMDMSKSPLVSDQKGPDEKKKQQTDLEQKESKLHDHKQFKDSKGTKADVYKSGAGKGEQKNAAAEEVLPEDEAVHRADKKKDEESKGRRTKTVEADKKKKKQKTEGQKEQEDARDAKGDDESKGMMMETDEEDHVKKRKKTEKKKGGKVGPGGAKRRGRRKDHDEDKAEKPKEKPQGNKSTSRRAGCIFPVARIHRFLKSYTTQSSRVGGSAGIFTAAVMEYLAAEVLELAGNVCADYHLKRITPRHLQIAIRSDEELSGFVKATIAGGGVIPNINKALFPDIKLREEEMYRAKPSTRRQKGVEPGHEAPPGTDHMETDGPDGEEVRGPATRGRLGRRRTGKPDDKGKKKEKALKSKEAATGRNPAPTPVSSPGKEKTVDGHPEASVTATPSKEKTVAEHTADED
mmetsp:Transcript_56610/g.106219  ORF Transcript_56610/g.106219 Transcript_56610/m.106219 type:complete len:465 (+) Transcript_56610:80-1474(+)